MASQLQQLVTGNRIFANQGVLDAYGHLSVRHPEHADRFVMSRSRAPELVTEDDLMTFDLEGRPMGDDKRGPYQERFIHAAIYAARPEVLTICHAHTPSLIPFGITDVPLKAVFHQAGFIGTSVPVWDIADEFGDTNMLVTNIDQGHSLARALGSGKLALMRGHGAVFVGRNVPEIVRTGVYLDVNARMLTAAHLMSGGKVHYLSDAEVALRNSQPGGPPGVAGAGEGQATGGREWEAWAMQVGRPVE